MADRLTQLQTCLDQLVTQFFSSLNYINQNHGPHIPSDAPSHVQLVEIPEAAPPDQLDASIKELSKDIVTKAKQIETLIASLPDLENASANLEQLEAELEAARQEEAAAAAEREQLLQRCDSLVLRVTEYKSDVERLTST